MIKQSDQPLLQNIEITQVIPCLADPKKIRFTADFQQDVSDVFPYLNTVVKSAIYNHAGRTLTIRKDGRLITLHSKHVSAAKINGLEDAQETVNWLVKLINDCHLKQSTINPNYDRRDRLTVLDIVRLLPGTNCKKCGQQTCLSFAALLASENASIAACRDIFMPDFRDTRSEILALLRASGYVVPDTFK
ncbi:Fe-S cluster protein [candidate division LCP-89 bacterium B3_LCP]|uniref:Fe-S cluster protein n=1 Tax=candidate division LCP-89 bacterium B3_LCP TaxID=2012998 RepID=A0A532UYI0_UNCL8|nr:MAG: Fe-S cluster protein [candidate division LCP-89 bacterium B3_LCP]